MSPTSGARSRVPYRRPAPDAARRAAYDVLRAVGERDAYANLVLPNLLRERGIRDRDAAFATELTYGALRGRGTYDLIIAACIDRPLDRVDPPVLDVLRLGAHQLLAMRVPTHAAVSATVEVARAAVGDGRSRFVNAVLRKVAARDLREWVAQLAPAAEADALGHLAVAHAHPRWVVSAFRDAVGGSLDALEALLEADNQPAAVSLVARPGRASREELAAAGAEPGRWSPYAMTLPSGNPGDIEAVRSGRAGVQDEGSQLVAVALTRAPLGEGDDARWLDMCAGPGGKAALLGALASSRGARLLAAEVQPHRALLVQQTVGDDADVVIANSTVGPWRPATFDRVLLDAPCTGLGALRRRPEARWRRKPQDVPVLAELQRRLLTAALHAVRPGGVVAYATCSPHLAETRTVVGDVLRRHGGADLIDARPLLPDVPELGDGPDVQLWPHVHATDAMYLAMLRKA